MKKSVWLVVISLLITAMACNPASASNPEEASQDGDNIVRVTGTVIYLTFEGGFWGIVGDNGQKYLPLGLPQELQGEGLRAEFELEILEDVATIYMWGIPVNVLDFEVIPPVNWPLIGGIIAAAAVAVGLVIFFVRRRRAA